MTPFGDLFYFYIMGLVLIPAIILGLLEKKIKYYGLFATIIMVFTAVMLDRNQIICIVVYYICEIILVNLYFVIRKKMDNIWLMRLAVLLSISPLILVKFSAHFTHSTLGFIGLSYITFRVVQVIIETYDGLIEKMNVFQLTYFLFFFPSLSCGPIDRSRNFIENTDKFISRKEYINDYLYDGLWKITKGVAYKFMFANLINTYWLIKISKEITILNCFNHMYAYSLYLFFDFAGYSLMAIGAGYVLGVKLPENFNAPFISRNMKEFWNRWHMSLSFWYRDFIYTRFTIGFIKKKRFKSRFTASYVAYMITMVTMGLWHGIELHYLIYGFYMAATLILTDYFQRKNKLYKKYKNKIWWKYGAIVLNFNVVSFGLLLFSGYLINK